MAKASLTKANIDSYYDPFGMLLVGRNWQAASSTEYRFGFNGKENTDEIYGNDNGVDFGARIYNPRLGIWLSTDPLFKQYPYSSPYTYAICNPIFYIDIEGKKIQVSAANPDIVQQFKTVVQNSFDNNIVVDINDNGIVTLNIKPDAKLTETQQAAFDQLKSIERDQDHTAAFILISDDKDVTTGDYFTGTIDVGDIEKYGNDDNLISTKTVIVHEATEQYEKDIRRKNGIDVETYTYYSFLHENYAVLAEQPTTNLKRPGHGTTKQEEHDGDIISTHTEYGYYENEDGTRTDVKWTSVHKNGNFESQNVEILPKK